MDLERFTRLKQRYDAFVEATARAEGRLEGLLAELCEKFDVKGLAEARKLARRLTREAEAAEAEYETDRAVFEKELERVEREGGRGD